MNRIKNGLARLLLWALLPKRPTHEPMLVLEVKQPSAPPPPEPRMTNIWGPTDDGSCQFIGRNLVGGVVRCPADGHARIFKRTAPNDGEMETMVCCSTHLPLVVQGEDLTKIEFDIIAKNG